MLESLGVGGADGIGGLARTVKSGLSDALFTRVHGNNLIYNMCWEDPRTDREAMALDETSRVVVITSAGCNALDYLLDAPAEVVAVAVGNLTIKTTASGSLTQSITVTGFKNSLIPKQICGRRSSLTTLQREPKTSKTSVANRPVEASEEASATRVGINRSPTAKMLAMLTPTKYK